MSLRSRLRFAAAALLSFATAARASETVIRLDAPAKHFTESTPLGNGRLGAMLFGGVDEERIVLNESGMWSGSPQDADRPDAAAVLPEIRRLLLAGKNVEAEALVSANFTCAGAGSGHANGINVPYGSYQVLGDLHLRFHYPDTSALAGPAISDYTRELDLAEAVGRIAYTRGGVRYTREAFVSAPGEAFVLKLTADRDGALAFDLSLDRPERFVTEAAGRDGLRMTGQLNDGHDGTTGVRYAARLRVIPTGGSVEVDGSTLRLRGAREALVFVTGATDIKTFAGRKVTDAAAAADADLARLGQASFDELRYLHVADYRQYFDRAAIRLGPAGAAADPRSAPARLAAFAAGTPDPGLAELYFNFGRYLLISSSRPGGLPANLQGIWTDGVQTPWNGDWHLNVNVQMNYWPAEVAGLGELHTPLFALIGSLVEPGARTAQKYYGSRGWVAHVLSNPWGFTSPGEGASWGSSTTGSAWLCMHLWEHYLYRGDRAFLEKAYPILKGSAQFYSDMLIAEPSHGWLVTAPSNSPENAFLLPDGGKASVCYGATYDQQLIRALFSACIETAETLGTDADLRKTLAEQRAKLAPTRIASDGRVMEWQQEYQETDPHHRHISHLWGLFPGNEITPARTPELAAAARKTLEARGDGGTGWCIAHKLGLWARLGDGDRAHALLRSLFQPATVADRITVNGGGSYPNLFCSHPPFQIDGNFGGAAGIAELLLQSHAGEIQLLPALPSAWPGGEARGLRARGGFSVDFSWREGRVVATTVHGQPGAVARVRVGAHVSEVTIPTGGSAVVAREDDRPVEDAAKIATAAKADPNFPTLWIIGDSTVKVGTKGQRGWGEEIAVFFDTTKLNVVNRAIGGRSSRTFITDGRWDAILAELKAGDFVIMQFGHNDGGAINDDSRARGTLKGTGDETQEIDNLITKKHEVVHTYGWYMRRYVMDTKAKGATPIICSPIPRKIWRDGKIARAAADYGGWAREIAEANGAAFVDLNEIIAVGYEALGPEKVARFFADERTHTTEAGARFNARAVIAGLRALTPNPLEPYLKPSR